MVRLNIAGLKIDFKTRFPEYVKIRCSKYIESEGNSGSVSNGAEKNDGADLTLEAREEDIRRANREMVGDQEAELYAMTIPLSERLPDLNRIMTHGVAICCDGKGFIFTAESGVGKSTHAFLWQKYLGADRVRIINGDKPILWFNDPTASNSKTNPTTSCSSNLTTSNPASTNNPGGTPAEIFACGTPWSGKEHLDENICVPLKGICLLRRLEGSGETAPKIERASEEEALDFLMHQVFLPKSGMGQIKTLQLIEKLYNEVPIYKLTTDMSREGVKTSVETLLGNY